MKRPEILATSLLASALLLSACSGATSSEQPASASSPSVLGGTSTTNGVTETSSGSGLTPWAVMAENADYTTVNDDEWSEADAVDVALSGSGLSGSATGVTAEGSTVTITQAGVYRISGSLTGALRVEAPEDALVVLILDGAQITNPAGAAIEVVSADDVAIHLASGSQNSVSDASSYADDATADAAIFADTDLTISGQGSLTVSGNGNDGIVSKDDLVILDGTITVNAVDDALRGKDSLIVEGGRLALSSTSGDGMKSNGDDDEASADIDWTKGYIYISGGTIDITAGDDGIQAFTDTVITGGSVTAGVADDGVKAEVIVSIGLNAEDADASTAPSVTVTESTEGIEAANIGISAGTISVTADDDGLNASGNAELQALIAGTEYVEGNREADTGERLVITGGDITIKAGFDGIDSNGSITVTGGTVTITSAANGGDAPLDANGQIDVADGIITANGAAWSAATADGMAGGPGGGRGGGPGGGPDGMGTPPEGAPGGTNR